MCRQEYSLIKSWQIEGWSAFLQGPVEFGLSVFACEDQPFFFFFLRTNLNWKDETEECILRVVRSPGSGHQEVWVLPLTLPATYQGHLPRVPVFLPSHHPMLSLKQLSKCFNVSLPCGLVLDRLTPFLHKLHSIISVCLNYE